LASHRCKEIEIRTVEITVLAKGELVDEITTLKEQGGKDICAGGGETFVSVLIK